MTGDFRTGDAEGRPARIRAEKALLRATITRARDDLTTDDRTSKSEAIAARFATLAEARVAGTVFCYVAFRSEVDTLPVMRWCLRQGKAVAAPRIARRRHMDAWRLRDPEADLVPGSFGIREPRSGLEPVDPSLIDLVVVPGTAFDEHGHRVGYGEGYYDTFAPRLHPHTDLVALAFDLQVVAHVPHVGHDRRMSVIVTESRVIHCGP